ncbi:extracellular solute-binding protein [Paenibacillus mesophilus]|uniref:ABC transporter substrate-binding protein n=1 Tax=Paenibacillus mesophilus TaxID=2582849 RepID=UPI00110E824B|nr:extracellular solute-binding protein [Paenibacillus mesophilus]TMV47426.1 extracellular solute-binding protein [Paenibacillus mesophilus]
MNHNLRKSLSAVCIGAALTVALAGCGKTGDGAKPSAEQPGKPASKEPVELVIYNASNSGATLETFLASEEGKRITEKFPHVKVKFIATGKGTMPQEVIASGEKIDLIINSVFSFPILMEAGLLFDMSDLLKKNKYDLSRLEPTAIEFQRQLANGGIFGLPISNTAVALFYNKDLFNKFGVPYPKDGMTWDEVYELAKKLTRSEGGTDYYGFATRYPFMFNVNQLSLSYLDPKTNKPTLNDDKFKLFIDNFTRFARISGNEKATTDSFSKDQKTAMMAFQSGNWGFDSWDAVSLPYFKEAPGIGPQVYATYMNIASTSKNKDVAYEILADLTSDEYQMKKSKAGSMPIVTNPDIIKAFDQESGKFKGKNVSAFFPAKRASPSTRTKYDDLFEKKVQAAFNDISAGTKDTVTALREAAEAATKEMAAIK